MEQDARKKDIKLCRVHYNKSKIPKHVNRDISFDQTIVMVKPIVGTIFEDCIKFTKSRKDIARTTSEQRVGNII